MTRRAQSAVEFVIITVVMMTFFSVAFIGAQATYSNIQEERLDQLIQDYFVGLETEFAVAWELGDGYEREIRIPPNIANIPYTVQLRLNESPTSTDELSLTLNQEEYFYFIQYPVNGTIGHGWYTIQGGDPVQIAPRE